MIIESVQIINFKSIKDFTLNFNSSNINGINAGIFVGLNESGKSSLLESISMINKGFNDLDYINYCNLDGQEDDDYMELYVKYTVLHEENFKNKLKQLDKLPKSIIDQLSIKSITRNIYINIKNGADELITTDIEDLDYNKYVIEEKK